jgi:hypothetical protein
MCKMYPCIFLYSCFYMYVSVLMYILKDVQVFYIQIYRYMHLFYKHAYLSQAILEALHRSIPTIHMYINMYIYMYVYASVSTWGIPSVCVDTNILYIYVYTYIYIYIFMYTHTYIYILIYIHVNMHMYNISRISRKPYSRSTPLPGPQTLTARYPLNKHK